MIVRDESHNLAECVGPVRDLFDEIVIVDTGSVDNTRDLAKELGAKVVDFPWCDDFGAARNASLDNATGDYIFWLDADDRIDAANREQLAQLFASLDETPTAYVMATHCHFWHASMPVRKVTHARLFPNHPEARYVYRVHEQILPQLQKYGCQIEHTGIVIDHVGYKDEATHNRKALRDLRLVKMDYAAHPDDPIVLFELGITYLRMEHHNDGLMYLLRSLKVITKAEDWVRKLYLSIVTTLVRLGRSAEANSMALQGLQNFPYDASLLMEYASLALTGGDYIGAEQALRRVLSRRDTNHLSLAEPVAGVEQDARRNLATVYRMQGRLAEAEQILQQLLADEPEYTWGWLSLGYLYLQRGHLEQAKLTARRLERCPLGTAYALCLLAEVDKTEGRYTAALNNLTKAREVAPQLPLVRIVRLETVVAMQAGLEDVAIAAHEVLQVDPSNEAARQVMAEIQAAQTQSQLRSALTSSIAFDSSMRIPTYT
ncbi:MAG: glycosyltransferase [Planctomycetaceae bacterium]|nr:glycosyltransferase [Planctomycetaceae bacterium]